MDRPADRKVIAKTRELWNKAFNGREAGKSCWEICEDCMRIRRKKDRKRECDEGHLVWTALELKCTYYLESVEDLMKILDHMRKDRMGEDGLGFRLPEMPRKKKKTKKVKRGKEVERATEE